MDLVHKADILAIPFFLIAFLYFFSIKNKSLVEFVLMLFVLCGFIVDCIFTYQYLLNISK